MPMALSGPSRPPAAGGNSARLVVLLHGRGSDGDDLLDLQRFWGPLLPEAEFIAPHAPFPSDMNPRGHECTGYRIAVRTLYWPLFAPARRASPRSSMSN